jgi:hypothetical protein
MPRVRSRRALGLRNPLATVSLDDELAARLDPRGHPAVARLIREAEEARPNRLAALRGQIAVDSAGRGDRDKALRHLDLARWARERTPLGGHVPRVPAVTPAVPRWDGEEDA